MSRLKDDSVIIDGDSACELKKRWVVLSKLARDKACRTECAALIILDIGGRKIAHCNTCGSEWMLPYRGPAKKGERVTRTDWLFGRG